VKRILFELSESREGADDGSKGSAVGPTEEGVTSAGFSPLADGRFRKEIIREGTWVHPTRNFRLSVTRDRMQRWVDKFRLMQKRGIRVPVPFGHSYDPKDNAGFVEDLQLDGNVLFAVICIPRQEDTRKVGATVRDVSISINPDFRDGQGRRYGEVIEHVALTTRPVVPGQGDFVPLALPDGSQAELWCFEVEDLAPRRVENLRPRRLAGDSQTPGAQSADPPTGRPTRMSGPGETTDREEEESSPTDPLDRKPPQLAVDAEEFRRLFGLPEGTETERMVPAAAVKYRALESLVADRAEQPADGQAGQTENVPAVLPVEVQHELTDLRQQHLERELEALVRSGRLTPAMREPARRLLALTQPVSVQLADGPGLLDVATELRALLEAVPEHALIDLRQRTLFEAPKPVGEMTDERAAELARENRRLAKLEA